MSIIFMDGFDLYATTEDLAFRYHSPAKTLLTNGGRFGGGAVETVGASSNPLFFALPGNPSEIWIGFAFNLVVQTPYAKGMFCAFISSRGEECTISYNQLTSVFTLYGGVDDTVLAISDTILVPENKWHWIDIRFKLASDGVVELWLDNNQIMHATLNTAVLGGASLLSFSFGSSTSNIGLTATAMLIDDIAVVNPNVGTANLGRIGDSRICTTVPASDATPNAGVPLTGTAHFAAVGELQWSAANTLTLANTTGLEEQFGVTALPVHPSSISAVQVLAVCEKTDAGAANAKLSVNSGGTVAQGPSIGILDPYNYISSIFQQDPNINGPWVEATVNNVQIGYTVQ